MAQLGNIINTQDMSTKALRSGTATVIITDLTKGVTFGTAMPSANYRVFLQVEESVSTILWPSAKTTAGFTINLSAGIVGTIAWVAVED